MFVVMLIVVIKLPVKDDLSDNHKLSRLQPVNISMKQSIFMNIQALANPGSMELHDPVSSRLFGRRGV
jgi:hypothetical protein